MLEVRLCGEALLKRLDVGVALELVAAVNLCHFVVVGIGGEGVEGDCYVFIRVKAHIAYEPAREDDVLAVLYLYDYGKFKAHAVDNGDECLARVFHGKVRQIYVLLWIAVSAVVLVKVAQQAAVAQPKARLALLRSGVVGQNVKVLAVFADILCLDYYL